MGTALLRHLEGRFAAGLALGLTLSVVLLLPWGGDQPTAARGIRHVSRFSSSRKGGRYDEIFERAGMLVAGIEELAAVWGNTSCARGIYMDVGSNVGVQVRKLYNPEQFPNAAVLPIFERLFTQAPRPEVCAVGFEPNPRHTAYLGTLNAWFRRRGYSAHIFTETAVGATKGMMPFYTARVTPEGNHHLGASLARVPRTQGADIVALNVSVISLVDFITKVVRPILDAEEHATGRRPPVAMKLDIEGAEYAVLPGLILSGALCETNITFVEWHPADMRTPGGLAVNETYMPDLVRQLRTVSPKCTTELSALDDETYLDGPSIPLP